MEFIADPQQRALYEVLSGAAARLDAGQPDDALKVLQSRGGFALDNPVGRNILGEIHLHQGKPAEALQAFDAALKLAPNFAEAHANRGAALLDLGRLMEALDAERRALRLKPGYATANFNRGIVLAALDRGKEAIDAFSAAIKERPDYADAFLNRAVALLQADRPLEALSDFNRAQSLKPDLVGAAIGTSSALLTLGHKEQALTAAERALALAPGDVEALNAKAAALVALELFIEALSLVDDMVARAPENTAAHAQRFEVLRGLRRFSDALAAAEAIVRLDPGNAESHATLAIALSELDRMEEALQALVVAERLGAKSHDYFHIRAILKTDLGNLDEARAAYRRAIAMAPENPEYRHHHGMFLLATGVVEKGLEEHEWRLRNPHYRGYDRHADTPMWRGEDVAGKRVLVLQEQGIGDTIQFARFVPEIARRGAATTFLVLRPLPALMRRSLPTIDVSDSIGVRSAYDYQVPVMSLPHLMKKTTSDLGSNVPYLVADPARIEKWRARLGGEGVKVGVVWQGNPRYARDVYRSIPLRNFAALGAIEGVRLISLQAVNGLDQLRMLPDGMRVETYGDEIERNSEGFDEIAALSASLDLVVSSDTGVVHLLGALGRPTWLALRYRPDWRWMYDRPDTPWYPTVRLFRQHAHGDWDGLFGEIAGELARLAEQKRANAGNGASR